MKKALVLVSVAAACLLVGCNEDAKPVTQKQEQEQPSKSQQTVTIDEKKTAIVIDPLQVAIQNKENDMQLDLTVPQVSGMKNKAKQQEMNAYFLDIAEQLKKETIEAEEQVGAEGIHASASLTFTPKMNNEQFISLLLDGYMYLGGAHGDVLKYTFVYDIEQEKELTLADVFESSDYTTSLQPMIMDSLKEQGLDSTLLVDFSGIRVDQPFYLTKDELVIVFDKYEYTAGVAGAPEIPITKKELPSLKEKFK